VTYPGKLGPRRSLVIALIVVLFLISIAYALWLLMWNDQDTRLDNITPTISERPHGVEDLVRDAALGKPLFLAERLGAADLEQAKEYIAAHPDHTSSHLLYAIREHFPDTYATIPEMTKARILCSALARAELSFDWGTLYPPDQGTEGVGGEAITELRRHALPFLVPILQDRHAVRAAAGSMTPLEETYQYRRADYAYRYICVILKQAFVFDPDPKARDRHIAELKKKLDALPSGR
jgi:hypothetical protein